MSQPTGWQEARRAVHALVGRRAWAPCSVLVRASDIVRYCEALRLPAPRPEADGELTAPALFLPPTAAGGTIGPDGRRRRPDELVIDHPALTRRLMAGCEVEFEAPIRSGEVIEVDTVVYSVQEKQGSAGPMLLVTTATTYRGADGGVRRVERWTIVHR